MIENQPKLLPLDGVMVLDLSRVLAGPQCSMVLGDLGADVIKVEHPRGDDTRDWGLEIAERDTTYFYSVNRNKRSITADLATERGRRAVENLCRRADVVIENFKTGDMERFGLGYETLKISNPNLIYCAISGYGRTGAEAARPGYDLVLQGEAGLMAMNGEATRPPLKFGVAVVDLFTGMYAAQAVLACLFARAHGTGGGRRIDIALYDCGVMVTSYYGLEALLLGKDPPRYGNAHPSIVPYGVFDCADGPIVLTVGTNAQFTRLCNLIERPDLAADPRYTTNLLRSRNRKELLAELEAELGHRRRQDLLSGLAQACIPSGEVLGLHQALVSSRTKMADLVTSMPHPEAGDVSVMAPPYRLDGRRLPVRRRPPRLGEHSCEFDGGTATQVDDEEPA